MDSIGTTSYIGQPLVVAVLVSWLLYKCSDTVEQSVISRGSNDERLTDVDFVLLNKIFRQMAYSGKHMECLKILYGILPYA